MPENSVHDVVAFGTGQVRGAAKIALGRRCVLRMPALISASLVYGALCIGVAQAQPVAPLRPLQDVVQVATGGSHTCALTADGAVRCWGANEGYDGSRFASNTPVEVSGLGRGVRAITAGAQHACALTDAGSVKCWGTHNRGQLGDGSITDWSPPVSVMGLGSGLQAISAGAGHTCALTATGGVKCWGGTYVVQPCNGGTIPCSAPQDVPGLGSGVRAISAGESHTCALTTAGGVKCWGDNYYGQLGYDSGHFPDYAPYPVPVDVAGLTSGVQAISAGRFYTCAVTTAGAAKCWGFNEYGKLGNGVSDFEPYPTPVNVVGLGSGVSAISTDVHHTCALSVSGAVRCWGVNYEGQLGDGSGVASLVPVNVEGLAAGVTSIDVGGAHACAVKAGRRLACWGFNGAGQLGNGGNAIAYAPTEAVLPNLIALPDVTAISAGHNSHACALTSGGGIACWGGNAYGQLGNGSSDEGRHTIAEPVAGLDATMRAVATGGRHSCGITTGGAVKCWGYNLDGQLGNGTTVNSSVPVDVIGLGSNVASISLGLWHGCALTQGGAVWCWGRNGRGELGNATVTSSAIPMQVTGLGSGIRFIDVGGQHTCALTGAGVAWCWGDNYDGQLGDGNTITSSSTPVAVSDLGSGVLSIGAGHEHSCAVTAAGSVKCWGRNHVRQLGNPALNDGTNSRYPTPMDVPGLPHGVLTLDAGNEHTCALTTAGEVKCWGGGQTGFGGNGPLTIPTTVSGLIDAARAISAGNGLSCAVTVRDQATCWGANFLGQLGNARVTPSHSTPQTVLSKDNRQVFASGFE